MSKYIRQFSEIAFNKAFKLKTLEIPEYLEKSMRRYVNEQLIKHTNDINKLMYENKQQILQTIDKKNQEEFWKFTKISFNGFSALFGLGLLGYSSLIGIGYTIKNEIKVDIKEIKDELNNKIEKLENKINDIDKKLDIIISSKKK